MPLLCKLENLEYRPRRSALVFSPSATIGTHYGSNVSLNDKRGVLAKLDATYSKLLSAQESATQAKTQVYNQHTKAEASCH